MKLSTTSLFVFSVLVLVLGTSGDKSPGASEHPILGEAGQKDYSSQHANETGEVGHHDNEIHQKDYAEGSLKKAYNHDQGYSQQSAPGEAGQTDYSSKHANETGEVGHHDNEIHQKDYAEEGSLKKAHHHDQGYSQQSAPGEAGQIDYSSQHANETGEVGHYDNGKDQKKYAEEGSLKKAHHHDQGYSQQSAPGESGQIDYSSQHANETGEVGHHDNEIHQKDYAEGGSLKKAHHHDQGYSQQSAPREAGQKDYSSQHANEKGEVGHYDNGKDQKKYAEEGSLKKAHHHDQGYSQQSAPGEAGQIDYSSQHANETGEVGHHDNEIHQKDYAEGGSLKKAHHHDQGYSQQSAPGGAGQKDYSSQHANEKGEVGHYDNGKDQKEYAEEGGHKEPHYHGDGYSEHSARGEAGQKGYSPQHANEKGDQKEYADEGHKNAHHHDDRYYTADHKQSHGEAGYHYIDKGSYAKGLDTKGPHNVHKLDEFQKKKAFFDEHHNAANKEKHDAVDLGKIYNNGEFENGGHAKKDYVQAKYGDSGKSEKGGHNAEVAGYKKVEGWYDNLFKGAEEFAKREFFKDFGYIVEKIGIR